MNFISGIIMGGLILLFIALGIVFSSGKGSFLIAGFNTMSKTEKAEYNETALCKFMGKVMFIMGFCVALWMTGEIAGVYPIFYAGLIMFFAVIIFTLIYANTGNRFKNNSK